MDAAAVEAGHITFESMKQCADSWLAVVDTLNTVAPGWSEKEGTGRECATATIAALAQQPAADDSEQFQRGWQAGMLAGRDSVQPAACPKCDGTGEADSGGIMPWGAPAMIPCDCKQPAAVDGLNDWRAAFVAERAMRYREGGMAIEQARIHAETDAARMAVLAAAQQRDDTDE